MLLRAKQKSDFFAFFFFKPKTHLLALKCICTVRYGLKSISSPPFPLKKENTKRKHKNRCELTYKSSNSSLIYFISCLHAILFVLKHFIHFLLFSFFLLHAKYYCVLFCCCCYMRCTFSVLKRLCPYCYCCSCFYSTLISFATEFTRGVWLILYGYFII